MSECVEKPSLMTSMLTFPVAFYHSEKAISIPTSWLFPIRFHQCGNHVRAGFFIHRMIEKYRGTNVRIKCLISFLFRRQQNGLILVQTIEIGGKVDSTLRTHNRYSFDLNVEYTQLVRTEYTEFFANYKYVANRAFGMISLHYEQTFATSSCMISRILMKLEANSSILSCWLKA